MQSKCVKGLALQNPKTSEAPFAKREDQEHEETTAQDMNDGHGDKDDLTQEALISNSSILMEQISDDQAKAFLQHTPQPDFDCRDDTSVARVNNLWSASAQQL
ncbi:hypothetical protein ACH5RR_021610 [Cinchona calisaya]|uniref:Uncharacterized protein n=1 Tax=Cinchona calisaya TaxID=153742 RepID=A0ABD2ZHS0_9GENT